MKKSILYAALLIILSHFSIAQDLNWAGSIGGSSSDVCKNIGYDVDGNVYVSGYVSTTIELDGITMTSNGSSDFYLGKYSKEGNILWAFNIGGELADAVEDIHITDDGTIFLTGYFNGSVDFDPSNKKVVKTSKGSDDVFLARYSTQGSLVWVKTFGGEAENSVDRAYGLAVHPSGYIFITGHYGSEIREKTEAGLQVAQAYGDLDVFYAKYDFRGRNHFIRGFGSEGRDEGQGIEVSDHFKIYISGYYSGTMDIDPTSNTNNLVSDGGNDAFLIKYRINGSLEWGHSFGSIGNDRAVGISLYDNTSVYITGYFTNSINLDPLSSSTGLHLGSAFEDAFIAKFKADGTYQWSKSYGGNLRDYGRNVEVDKHGNVYTTGMFTNSVFFDLTNPTTFIQGAGGWDAYFVKFGPNGDVKWNFSVAGPDLDYGYDIIPNDAGEFFIAGRFTQQTTFGKDNNVTLVAKGVNDAFYAKYSEMPSTPIISLAHGNLTSNTKSNNQWYKDGVAIVGAVNQTYTPTESGVYYTVVQNFTGSAVSNEIEFKVEEDKYKIKTYPNPSNGNFVINTNFGYQQSYNVQIVNFYGQVYYNNHHYGETTRVYASYLRAGVYKLIVTFNGEKITKTIRVK